MRGKIAPPDSKTQKIWLEINSEIWYTKSDMKILVTGFAGFIVIAIYMAMFGMYAAM